MKNIGSLNFYWKLIFINYFGFIWKIYEEKIKITPFQKQKFENLHFSNGIKLNFVFRFFFFFSYHNFIIQ